VDAVLHSVRRVLRAVTRWIAILSTAKLPAVLPKSPQQDSLSQMNFKLKVAPVFAYQMYRAIPGAQFTVFEKSGHLPFAEEPDAFTSRVASFLSSITSGSVK